MLPRSVSCPRRRLRSRARSPFWRQGIGISGAVLVVASLTAGLAGEPVASASTKSHQSAKATKVATGAMPSYALAPGDIFTWVLPLEPESAY